MFHLSFKQLSLDKCTRVRVQNGCISPRKAVQSLINVVAMYCTYMYQSYMNVERVVIASFEDRNGTFCKALRWTPPPLVFLLFVIFYLNLVLIREKLGPRKNLAIRYLTRVDYSGV